MAHEVLIKTDVNLYSLMCKFLQGNKMKSDHNDKIMVHSRDSNIILDCCIKIHDSWIARVEFLQETGKERAQLAINFNRKDINDLHAELGHLFKAITHTTTKSMCIHLTGSFKLYEDFTMGKAKTSA